MRRHLYGSGVILVIGALVLSGATPVAGQKADMLDKVMQALPETAPVKPKQPRKLLIFSRSPGYRHSSIAIGAKALIMMGDKTGAYLGHHTEDESFFEPDKLKAFDAVFMLNSVGSCLRPNNGNKEREEELKKSLLDYVSLGKGLAGCHGATASYENWKEYNQLIGGAFAGHPWIMKVPIKNLVPNHPVNAAFEGKDFEIHEETYQFRADTALPTERKFLLALDTKVMDVSKGSRKDGLYPVSWISTYGKGKTFYCSLGHGEEIYWNPAILKHYLAGIQYVLGDLEADATPTASK